MSTGLVFCIYDALNPVPDMPHLGMDTEDQPTLRLRQVQRHRERTFLALMAVHVLTDHIHVTVPILPDE